jgi:hypothetical protein
MLIGSEQCETPWGPTDELLMVFRRTRHDSWEVAKERRGGSDVKFIIYKATLGKGTPRSLHNISHSLL